MRYILFLLMLLGLSDIQAKPVINIETHYYEVDGKNAQEIRKDMKRKHPDAYDAYTAWRVDWRFFWFETAKDCHLTKVKTTVGVKFTLPKLVENNQADKETQQRWARYYQALIEHENGHRDFGIRTAEAIESALLAMGSRQNCIILERDANNLGYGILNQAIADEKQYDIDTQHGMKYGAVFP